MEELNGYAAVNAAWPDTMPVPTGEEALRGARLLVKEAYRFHEKALEAKRKRTFKLTSGRRYTWPRRGVWYVNPTGHHFGGWKDIVHDISHFVHQQVNPKLGRHEGHVMTERHLVEYVVRNGWLEGRLKPKTKKPAIAPQEARYAKVLAGMKRWQSKAKRASTALKKLARKKAYYEKRLGVGNA
jgi:hypothetical protein